MRITLLRTAKFLVFVGFCVLTLITNNRIKERNEGIKRAVNPRSSTNVQIWSLSPELHVVSVVKDGRNGNMGYPFVRLLVMATTDKPKTMCRFPSGVQTVGSYYEFSENHMQRYGTYYISCEIPKNDNMSNVNWIEVTTNATAGWHMFPISYNLLSNYDNQKFENEYSICVPTLFGDSYTAERFVEFAEFNKILGADKIILYLVPNTTSNNLKKTFKHYTDEGLLEIRNIKLPIDDGIIWYHAQLITVTDCLLRNTGISRYVSFNDLDEFMVPMNTTSVPQYLNKVLIGNTASLRVQTNYVNMKDKRAPIVKRNSFSLPMLDKLLTKCVLRPEMVFEQGIHHTSRVIQDHFQAISGNSDELRLFHFKPKHGSKPDNFLIKSYGETLQSNYDEVLQRLQLGTSKS